MKDLRNKKVLFADLDGTLIDTISGATFPKGIWDCELKFNVLDAIKKMRPDTLYIVTNQGGIDLGHINEDHFEKKIQYIVCAIREYCGFDDVYYRYCPSNDRNNPWRKPNTRMLEDLAGFETCDKSEMLMIGDASGLPGQFSDSDRKAADNFGIDYLDVDEFVKL